MATFVLVHGAWMGAFAWDAVRPLLEAQGHTVLTPELPAHGADQTPAEQATLDGYAQAVRDAIGDRSEVVLVGHSLAGVVISSVAEAIPNQIKRLIYVCAYLPRSGESLYQLSQEDPASHIGAYWRQEHPEQYSPASVAAEGIVEVFGADCSPADQELLVARHRPEPVPPMATPVTLTEARYGSVPRSYIATLHDACVSHQLQMIMLSRTPVERQETLETGHSPFFAQPDALTRLLVTMS